MTKKEKRNRCKIKGKWYKRAESKVVYACYGCYLYEHSILCDEWPTCIAEEREDATECIWVLDRKYGKKGKANETRTSG